MSPDLLVVADLPLTAEGADALRRAGIVLRDELPGTWTPVTSPVELEQAAAQGRDLWLRGAECGGPIGEATALTLMSAASATGRRWIASGLGIRAMAAAVACGAAGVVLDAHLWLTRGSGVSEAGHSVVRSVRSGTDTVVLGELEDRRIRVLARDRQLEAPQHVAEALAHDGRPIDEAAVAIVRRLRSLGGAPRTIEGATGAVATSPERARAAFDAGDSPLLAGSEGGGAVGRLTSIGLWEEALALPSAQAVVPALAIAPDTAFTRRFAAAMCAGWSEVRLSGPLAPPAPATTLVGASLGRPFRCARSPEASALRGLERSWEAARRPRAERERDWDAALRRHPVTAASVGGGAPARPRWASGPVRRVTGAPSRVPAAREDEGAVAIVGLGCVLPGGLDVPSFWRTLVEGRSAIGPIPRERWDEGRYHLPGAGADGPVLSSSRLAGVVRGFRFDAARFRIPPRVAPTMDPSQRLALAAAEQAVRAAGLDRGIDRTRAAVILGNSMGGEHAKSLALRVRFRDVIDAVARDEKLQGWTVEDLRELEARAEERLAARLPPIGQDSMAGLLANVVAGRVASWLDWMGGNLTVDAACAASLAALTVAVDWLRSGRCDVVLAGGVDTDLSPETYVGFTRTLALSDTGSSPFSTRADGFVMGEGAAVLALQRLEDARRAGRNVLAVVRGVGQSSDGRGKGITAPRAEGQALAVERAWAEARRSPEEVGSIEAHGTGTSVGDRTEAQVLVRRFAHAPRPTWLGSVKSVVGHLKGGAGAASLTRAVLTLVTGVVPPTLGAGPVDPELGLFDSPLRLPRFPTALPRPLVAVSAFGFGGTDFHAVLSAGDPRESDEIRQWRAIAAPLVQPAARAAWEPDAAACEVASFSSTPSVRDRRVASPDDAVAAPERWVAVARAGKLDATLDRAASFVEGTEARLGTELFRGGAQRPVVLLFPGQGAPTEGAWAQASRIPAAARVLDRLRPRLGDPAELEEAAERGEPEAVHAVLYAVGVAVATALDLRPTEVLGHSLGGLGAAVAAGAWSDEALLPAVAARGRALAACPPGAMAALRAGEEEGERLARRHGLWVATVNAPDQVVLAGDPDDIAALGPDARVLPVARAYHTPRVAAAEAELRAAMAALPSPAPAPGLRSGRTGDPVSDPLEDLAAGVVEPVRFARALERAMAAWPDALFVDVGPGRTLAGLAARAGADAVAVDDPRGPAVAAAALLAAGHPGFLRALPATLAEIVPRSGAVAGSHEPPAAPPPAEPSEPAGDDVRSEVLRVVSEATGYPAAFLTDGAQLEADLGVDSIRKMQILGALEQRFAFATPEADLTSLVGADLAFLVAHVERHRGTLTATQAAAAPAGVRLRMAVGPVPVERGEPALPDLVVPPGLDPAEALRRLPARTPTAAVVADDAGGAAAAGWLRCLAREQGVELRLVHAADPALVPSVTSRGESGADGRAAAWIDVAPEGDDPLPDGVIVLATGGLRGILRPCLTALADRRPRVVLLHRPGSAQDEGLAELAATGIEVRAVPGEVAEPGDVRRAVEAARAAFGGPPQVVVHAAGVLRDAPADRVGEAERRAVLAPKWGGAVALLEATAELPLLRFVTFSSLAAHAGNVGQAAYAAANAAMETLRHPHGRTLHLAFGPWSDVGMASDPTLQRVLRQRGLAALAPAEGARAFATVIGSTLEGTVRIGGEPGVERRKCLVAAPCVLTPRHAAFRLRLDPQDPCLRDHRISGRALVPAALWVASLLRAVRELQGSSGGLAVERFEIRAPVFVDRPRSDVRLVLRHIDGGYDASIEAGGTVVCHAHVRVGDTDSGVHPPPAPLVDAEPARELYRPSLLFHGPAWQVLDRVAVHADGHLAADLVGSSTLAEAVDGAHQVLAAWSGRTAGWLGLPVGAARWAASGGTAVRIETRARLEGRELWADVVGLDADGVVVLRGEDVRLRAATDAVHDA